MVIFSSIVLLVIVFIAGVGIGKISKSPVPHTISSIEKRAWDLIDAGVVYYAYKRPDPKKENYSYPEQINVNGVLYKSGPMFNAIKTIINSGEVSVNESLPGYLGEVKRFNINEALIKKLEKELEDK